MRHARLVCLAAVAGAMVAGAGECRADVTLASPFTDGMVLQREAASPVWGWASPGERVSVQGSWAGAEAAETVADARGRWMAKVRTPEAGGPYTLTVRGSTTRTLSDVLIGEVWVCSGQSNMEWPLALAADGEAEAAQANQPRIRLFTVQNTISLHPRIDCAGRWEPCTPATARGFSAVGYYFARELHERLGVPVGVISADWGGTPAEAWSSEETVSAFREFADQMDFVRRARDPETRASVTAGWEERWWGGLDGPGPKRADARWREPGFDAGGWREITLPSVFTGPDLEGHDGIVYLRREVELTPEFAAAGGGGAGRILLGPIDDRDEVWINGTLVGSTRSDGKWSQAREYEVPAGLLRAGTNVVAIRVLDTGGMGAAGIASGRAGEMAIEVGLGPSARRVAIDGVWKYAVGPTMRELPPLTDAPQIGPRLPTTLFNGMISPLVPMGVRGVIWYQGESNVGNPALYERLFPAMIGGWREAWASAGWEGEMPFLFVQIAPYRYNGVDPERVARLREAQAKALATPGTGMAVTLDIGDAADIHPTNKKDVGKRLAAIALAQTYEAAGVEWSGPIVAGVERKGGELRVRFDHADGLTVREGTAAQVWVAGEDKMFRPARVRVEEDGLALSHPEVERPVAARYAWDAAPQGVIFNGAGLPAAPFRTDDWRIGESSTKDDGKTGFLTNEEGFVPLFNGTDLSGWVNVNCAPSTWRVADGTIVCSGSPVGLLRTEKQYENFVLEAEFRHMRPGGNAGIFVWSDAIPVTGQPFTRSVEVQVMDGQEGDWYTSDGDIFPIWGARMTPENGRGGSRAFPTERRMNPSPHWNHYRITCVDGEISLAVNGSVVTRGKNVSPRKGYVCLESEGSEVHFRNIFIKELPPSEGGVRAEDVAAADEGFVPLYNGVDLAGWKRGPGVDGHWTPSDHVLRYDGKGDHLWSERSYGDFVLIADWRFPGPGREVDRPVFLASGDEKRDAAGNVVTERVMDAGDSGIYLRGSDKSQVNIWCWPAGSGEVWGYRTDASQPAEVRAAVTPKARADAPIGEWNRFVITMKGDRLTVVLNGKTVIENAQLPGVAREGPIALQHHGDAIEFANIYIKELK